MSLMDDFNAGKLYGWYFCKVLIDNKNHVCPVFISKNENDFEIKDVLAPCDYEELQRLKKENDNLSALITGGELEIGHLRILLKECKPYIQKEMETIKGANFCNCDWAWKTYDLLTCINVALGESEK